MSTKEEINTVRDKIKNKSIVLDEFLRVTPIVKKDKPLRRKRILKTV